MKCLSLWQPWAHLLVTGQKRVETRGWRMHFRGPLLIHAALTWNDSLANLCDTEPFAGALRQDDNPKATKMRLLRRGVILGEVEVLACYPTEQVRVTGHYTTADPWLGIPQVEAQFGDYRPGRFAFLCGSPVVFREPLPYRGRQGLFEVPDAMVAKARATT